MISRTGSSSKTQGIQDAKRPLHCANRQLPQSEAAGQSQHRQKNESDQPCVNDFWDYDQERDGRKKAQGGDNRQRRTNIERSFPLLPSHRNQLLRKNFRRH